MDRGADYVLALKGNQKGLAEDVVRLFEWAHSIDFAELQHDPRTCVVGRCHVRTVTKGHGRIETRQTWTISDPRFVGDLRQGRKWKALRSVAQVTLERQMREQVTVETRYYISSLAGAAKPIQHAVRSHWESVAEFRLRLLVHPFRAANFPVPGLPLRLMSGETANGRTPPLAMPERPGRRHNRLSAASTS